MCNIVVVAMLCWLIPIPIEIPANLSEQRNALDRDVMKWINLLPHL